jgi:hypothetical protein
MPPPSARFSMPKQLMTASGAAAGLRRSGFHPAAVREQARGRVALGPVHAPRDRGRALDRIDPAVDCAVVELAGQPAVAGLAALPAAVGRAEPAVAGLVALPAAVELAAQPAAVELAEPAVAGLAVLLAAAGLAEQPAAAAAGLAVLLAAPGLAAAAGFAQSVVVGPAAPE